MLTNEIQKLRSPRPLTHDLTKDIISALGCTVTKVRVAGARGTGHGPAAQWVPPPARL